MRIKSEKELLRSDVLKQLIEEIEGRENLTRKWNAYRRYQCYKDKISHYVVELLLRQFDAGTVEEMRYALSNISIVRKVVDKLARVYSNGVERTISKDEESTQKIKDIEKRIDLNSALKKANRFLKLERNVDFFIKPCPVEDMDNPTKWTVKCEVLPPFLYDVVEDYYDRTKAMCVILSDYQPVATALSQFDGKRAPVPLANVVPPAGSGDKKDQAIADTAADQKNLTSPTGEKFYVLWSKNLHFTFNSKGEIVNDPNNPKNENPLGVFNHINYAIDQDGAFWAEGGDDLIDGAVLINALITHTNHVGTVQGYGQFYMTGENLPRSIKVGPANAIIAEYKKDEQAEPKMGFLNANPQLDSLRSLIEMYIALYLTTNNLSTSGVATQLSSANSLPSGIALIIDKAESLEDVQDQRQIFADKEVHIFKAVNAILKTYSGELVEELEGLELPEGFEENFHVKYFDPTPIMSEKEKLENLRLRHDLGIDSLLSLLMKDDPSMDEKQAEEKLKKLIEQRIKEKMLEQQEMAANGVEYQDPNSPNPEGQNGDQEPDDEDPKPPLKPDEEDAA